MEKEEKEESLSFLDSRAIVISVAPLYHCWAAALQHRTWETRRRRRRRNQRATPIYWEPHEEKRSLSIDPAQPILRSTADSRDLLPFGEEEEMHQKKKKKKNLFSDFSFHSRLTARTVRALFKRRKTKTQRLFISFQELRPSKIYRLDSFFRPDRFYIILLNLQWAPLSPPSHKVLCLPSEWIAGTNGISLSLSSE